MHATTTAMVSVELSPPDDGIPMTFGHYRWKLAEAPKGIIAPPLEQAATIVVVPPRRGIYVYDRWFVGQAAEQLSYHVVVTAYGAAPTARIVAPSMVATGAATTLDGSTSGSPELRTLAFQWRLAVRPESSATMLIETDGATLTFAPDVAGEYKVELRVFDGELWSAPVMVALDAR